MNPNLFAAAAEVFAESLQEALEDHHIVKETIANGEVDVKFTHNGCEIKITVGEFWMYPEDVCYFVNVHHANGNFMCQTGTKNTITASINVGKAIHFANTAGDPIQEE